MTPTPVRLMLALPLLCCALAATAIAHDVVHSRESSQHEERMEWRQDGHDLRLHSGGSGVQVEAANTLRLRGGDTITALGSQPVRTPQSLLDGLKQQQGHSVALQVLSLDGSTRTVRWSPSEYVDLLPPSPPAPPVPPPPPPAARP